MIPVSKCKHCGQTIYWEVGDKVKSLTSDFNLTEDKIYKIACNEQEPYELFGLINIKNDIGIIESYSVDYFKKIN